MRNPLWAAALPGLALAGAVTRWLLQGSGNVYTALEKRFYIPDPDLGWRVARGGPVWLGLEVIAVLAGVVGAIVVAAWLIRRWERRRGRPIRPLRGALWLAGALTLAVPAWAFASGFGPAKGRETLPPGASAAAPVAADGIAGGLDVPAGRYEVLAHDGSAITASLEAGKEAFEARFARGIRGAWTGDPGDLAAPAQVEITVDAVGVDTGIALRSQHARDEYLYVGKYPTITLRIGKVIAARQDGPAQVAFRAGATVDFLGEQVPVEVTGTLRKADDAARTRLGLADRRAVVLVDAALDLTVSGTRLRADADSFDRDRIPIRVSLVLALTNS